MELNPHIIEECCRTLLPGYDAWQGANDYYFDHQRALRACDFFQQILTLTTGKWAGRPFDLQGWQVAIIGSVHGWRSIRTDFRRYRRTLITTARKSSKSHVAAGLGLDHLFAEPIVDPSIVVAAGSAEQAGIIYGIAAKMAEQEPELQSRCEIMARAIRKKTGSGGSMRFINSAAGTKHGTNESLVILDELHVIEDPTLADVLETSMRSREEPLAIYTSTCGVDPAALWAEVFDYGDKVRNSVINDPEFLPCMWQAGVNDDIKDPATWRKAQPNLGISVSEDEYKRDLMKALTTPRYLAVFKQLSLNLPNQSHTTWIPYEKWKLCAGNVNPPAGSIAYAGCDLSTSQDTTAFVMVFPVNDEVHVMPFVFLPKDNVGGLFKRMKRDKAPYKQFADRGHLILTEGDVIDVDHVIAVILEQAKKYQIKEILLDAAGISNIGAKLIAAGLNAKFVRQGWSLAEATRETEQLIYKRKLVHPNNDCLNWGIAGAMVHTDRMENIWPAKQTSTHRIDSVVSLVMAINSLLASGKNSQTANDNYYARHPELIVLN